MLDRLKLKLRTLTQAHKIDGEVDEELRYHLEKAVAQNISRGMTREEARRAALVGLGGLAQLKEASRDARGTRFIDEFIQDMRYGARVLLRSPGFTLVVIAMLGLGVGANTAIFSLVDKLLLRSLPVKEPERLVKVSAESVNPEFLNTIFSYPDYADYRDQNQVLAGLAAHAGRTVTLGQGDGSRRVQVSFVSSNYFDVVGAGVRGRCFLPQEEDLDGSAPVAVISDRLWAGLGSDPKIIGKPLILDNATFTVIGVAAKGFSRLALESPVEVWLPLSTFRTLFPTSFPMKDRRAAWLGLIGRMRPGSDITQARAGMESVIQSVFQANTAPADRSLPFNERHAVLSPSGKGASILRTELGPALRILTVLAALLLLLACANIASLLLSRAAVQRREIAVRLALGASRQRIIRMLLAQSSLLALFGAGLGLALAPLFHSVLLAFQPGVELAGSTVETSLDLRALGFALVIAAICGLLFGLVPALRNSNAPLNCALKNPEPVFAAGRLRVNIRSLLVAGQVALAVLMLIGSALLVRTLRNLLAIDPGFKGLDVAVVRIDLKNDKTEKAYEQFYEGLTDRLKGVQSVSGVCVAQVVPLTGSVGMTMFEIEGRPKMADENPTVDFNEVGPGYHELLGIPIIKGRGLTDADRNGAPKVVVVNESFARTFFPGQDAIGKRIGTGKKGDWMGIVGVARDVRAFHLTEPPPPHIDLPVMQSDYFAHSQVLVRSNQSAAGVGSLVRRVAKELDPTASVEPAERMSEILNDSIASARMASTFTTVFGLLALLLAAVGLYGVMAYSVNQRRREIGIRMALGASRNRVLTATLIRGTVLMSIGILLGVAGALAGTRLIRSLLYEVRPADLVSFVVAGVLLMSVGLLACYLPARRAAQGDPMSALRYE